MPACRFSSTALAAPADFALRHDAIAAKMAGDPAATCSGLIRPTDNAVRIDAAAMIAPTPLAVAERGPTPAARVTPANAEFCKVLGQIAPPDPNAPPIKFQVNLPIEWNGRSLQYGGGGFNGVLITGLAFAAGLIHSARLRRWRAALSPMARIPATRPSRASRRNCSRSTTRLSRILPIRSYKRVRDAAVALMVRAYGNPPAKLYFMGSSEGGREALTMAQRYPDDFDGIFARVPVINWVGLQHAGTRSGLATMGEG